MKIRKGLIIAAITLFALVSPVYAEGEGVGIPQQIAELKEEIAQVKSEILTRIDNLNTIFASKSEVDTLKSTITTQQEQIEELKKTVESLQPFAPSIVKIPYTEMWGDQPNYGTVTLNVGLPNIKVNIFAEASGPEYPMAAGFTGADGRITFENVSLTHSMGQKKYAEIEDSKHTGRVLIYSMPNEVKTFDLPAKPKYQ
jgi:hypothetical protein